ncbi:hypothetical protein IVA83_25175 [Bradyrhizobium sp. 143]|nr:hypothetical protein [Bradyrhizobium sp. 143]MCK1728664.1 hypothetical protein [Bradyrhizobium sp. 142]
MRHLALAAIALVAGFATPAMAQQAPPSQSLQNEADKGIKTENSGASGYVSEQDKPGSAAQIPGSPSRADSGSAATAPSAQNSGAGIAGAPGNKNGPPAHGGTVGSASQNQSVQQQDPANIKGLPGNKSGPPAKR